MNVKKCKAPLAVKCAYKQNMKPHVEGNVCGADHVISKEQCNMLGDTIDIQVVV